MNNMPDELNVYNSIFPNRTTCRKTDLANLEMLLDGDKPVALVSIDRNGTTSLFNELSDSKLNPYKLASVAEDCDDAPELIEEIVYMLDKLVNKPVILDEAGAFIYGNASDSRRRLDVLAEAAKEVDNKVAIRLHPGNDEDVLRDAGFEVYYLGRISYDEFKSMVLEPLDGTVYSIQEDALKEVYGYGPNLMGNNHLVYHAFKNAIADGRIEATLEDVEKAKTFIADVCNPFMISKDWSELVNPSLETYERLERLGLAYKKEGEYRLVGYITDRLSRLGLKDV